MTLTWDAQPTWGTMFLAEVAPEDSRQIRPSDHPSQRFNYWGLDAIDKGQFTEPEVNSVFGSEVQSTCVMFDTSHVLYCKLRPYLNKVIVPSQPGVGSTEWITLRPNPTLIERKYLAYVLRTKTFVDFATTNTTGARMPRANKEVLKAASIPIPYPDDPERSLAEQRRIVARLEALLGEVRELRQLQAEIEADVGRLMEAVLAEVFGEIESRHPGERPIHQLTSVTSGGTPLRSRSEYYEGGTIAWIKTGELRDSLVTEAEEHITAEGLENSSAKAFPIGTLLIAMYGQGQTRGRTGVLGIEAATNQACCAILPNPDEFDPFYLQYWFRYMYQSLRAQTESHGGNQPNLSQTIIRDLKSPLPNVEDQKYFVSQLKMIEAEVEQLQGEQEHGTSLLGELEQSILAQAFRGEL